MIRMRKSARPMVAAQAAGFLLLLVLALPLVRGAEEAPWKAPARAARKANPIPADEKSLAIGKELYGRECLSCHGSTGKGDGPRAKDLERNPGNLSSPKMWEQTDGELFWKITEGKRPMPSYEKTFTEEQRWHVVNYTRTLAPKPAGAASPPAKSAESPPTPPASPPAAAAPPKTATLMPGPAQAPPPPPPAAPPAPVAQPAADPAAASGQYVSREEYEKLRAEMQAMKAEMDALRQERRATGPGDEKLQAQVARISVDVDQMKTQKSGQSQEFDQYAEEMDRKLKKLQDEADFTRPGSTKFLVTGFTTAEFIYRENEGSTFSAGFNPIFLWKMSDRLFAEAELEFSLITPEEGSQTETSLEYANISYVVNDFVTVGAGKFLLPFGIFNERLHPNWINKLPDAPLPFDDELGIAPEAGIGAFVRGGVPAGPTKFVYDAYIDNGPSLITTDPAQAGRLDFDNFEDNNYNKAVGGRLGYLPLPELEVGYSVQYAKVNPGDFEDVHAFLQDIDVSYVRELGWLQGTIDARAEWVWSEVENATYDPTGALGFGPLNFDNDRNGGYLQLAYRPTKVSNKIIRNLEFVMRYDMLDVPEGSPGGVDEHRWTPGIDYWVTPSMVVKAAYQFVESNGAEDQNAVLLQAALGF